jgi:hypothetical protein
LFRNETRLIFVSAKAIKLMPKTKEMTTFNIAKMPVSKTTVTKITEFVYENRATIGNDQKMFYADVKGLIAIQLNKKAANRLTMAQIMERAYNIESYILAAGAASVTTEFIG